MIQVMDLVIWQHLENADRQTSGSGADTWTYRSLRQAIMISTVYMNLMDVPTYLWYEATQKRLLLIV